MAKFGHRHKYVSCSVQLMSSSRVVVAERVDLPKYNLAKKPSLWMKPCVVASWVEEGSLIL